MVDTAAPKSLTFSTRTSVDVDDRVDQARVMLWCLPRSTSSIVTKCLSAVPDSQVFFEPYYFCYESIWRLKSMGRAVNPRSTSGYDDVTTEEWLETARLISGEDCTGKVQFDMLRFTRIKKELENPDSNRKLFFLKDMANAIDGYYDFLPDKSFHYKYAFLIRNPIKVFSSWRKVMFELYQSLPFKFDQVSEKVTTVENFHMVNDIPENYTPRGHFFKEIYDLWKHVKENLDPNPVIIDSDDLLSDPATMLWRFCSAVGIPYTDDLLRWDGDPNSTKEWISAFAPPNDFEFLRIFCRTAFNSTHFLPPTPLPSVDTLTQDVRECVERTMPYYQEMFACRI